MHDETLLQIIEGCRKGRPASEKALFLRFAPRVLAIARRYAPDEPQALDFLQECFVVIFEKIHRFDAYKGPFEGWMYRVSVNVILQIVRKNRRHSVLVEMPPDLPDTALQDSDMAVLPPEKVLDAVRRLPDGYREVFNLYVFDNWSHREIAGSLGIAESASRSQLTRAKQLLKQQLQQVLRQYEQGLV